MTLKFLIKQSNSSELLKLSLYILQKLNYDTLILLTIH